MADGKILIVVRQTFHTCGCGGMADAQDSKSCGGDLVWVQVPPSARKRTLVESQGSFFLHIKEKRTAHSLGGERQFIIGVFEIFIW